MGIPTKHLTTYSKAKHLTCSVKYYLHTAHDCLPGQVAFPRAIIIYWTAVPRQFCRVAVPLPSPLLPFQWWFCLCNSFYFWIWQGRGCSCRLAFLRCLCNGWDACSVQRVVRETIQQHKVQARHLAAKSTWSVPIIQSSQAIRRAASTTARHRSQAPSL